MSDKVIKFYDTNALLKLGDKVFDGEKFFISYITLQEIENIKTSRNKDDAVKYQARNITRLLNENHGKYEAISYGYDYIKSILEERSLEVSPDNIICATAFAMSDAMKESGMDVVFVTYDLCCRMIANGVFGLNVVWAEYDEDNSAYKGYVEVTMTDEEMASLYEHMQDNSLGLVINQYVVIKNENGETVDRLKWNGEMYETVLMKPFKSNLLGTTKPLDDIQALAMDSIANNDITVLYGKAGSGKTTLPLSYIMQNIEKQKISKCYFIYSYEPLKGAKTLGFEKGTHTDKLLMSASIGNILSSKFGDIEQVRFMIERGQIDIIPTANIRGFEAPSDSVVIVTEAQNLDVYTLKTIIQRCKQGCKQIYEGDIIEQKDTNNQESGIKRMIDVFKGHKSFGCVKLKNNYRSPLVELADMM